MVDSQGLALPGVAVSAESANLQGIRAAVTSENGDYVFTLLPPGAYKVTFELSGFQRQERTVILAPTQTLPLDASMGLSGVSEAITVVGQSADVLTRTAQVATDFIARYHRLRGEWTNRNFLGGLRKLTLRLTAGWAFIPSTYAVVRNDLEGGAKCRK